MLSRNRIGWLPGVIQPVIEVADPPVEINIPQMGISRTRKSAHRPLTSHGSYIAALQTFEAHWAAMNAERGGTPATDLKLMDGRGVSDMAVIRTDLQAREIDILAKENHAQVATGDRDNLKRSMLVRIQQLRGAISAVFPKSGYLESIPRTPDFTRNATLFLAPFLDVQMLWSTINSLSPTSQFTPPLTLGTYTIANLNAEIAAMQVAFAGLAGKEQMLKIARKERDEKEIPARAMLNAYSNLMIGVYGPNSAQVAALPGLSSAPKSTPPKPKASGLWNSILNKAVFTWKRDVSKKLASYELRVTLGARWDAKAASLVAHIPLPATTYETDIGLTAPGSVAVYKVFAISTTGHESGSKAMKIGRE